MDEDQRLGRCSSQRRVVRRNATVLITGQGPPAPPWRPRTRSFPCSSPAPRRSASATDRPQAFQSVARRSKSESAVSSSASCRRASTRPCCRSVAENESTTDCPPGSRQSALAPLHLKLPGRHECLALAGVFHERRHASALVVLRNGRDDRLTLGPGAGETHDGVEFVLRNINSRSRASNYSTSRIPKIAGKIPLRPAAQPSYRSNTSVALAPPKPKLLDMMASRATPSRRSRTTSMPSAAGSSCSMLAEAQMKPCFIISSE